MIPDKLQSHIQQALDQAIKSDQQVSGGSINQAAKITLSDGRKCFLKWHQTADPAMFEKEEKGLNLLASAETGLRVPDVFATGQTEDNVGYLVQEFITEGRANPDSATNFGRNLALLHQHHKTQFGLDHENFIGRLPQSNNWHENWIDFFVEERMQPQLQMATDAGKLGNYTISHFESMYKQLPEILPEQAPSLLHGDLWGGNYFYDEAGNATIYDPAVYYGHREIELAFTHLFGGFSGDFYRAYKDAYPLEPEFNSRKDLYNLYPLLVHANMFGGHYAQQVKSIVKRF